MKFTILTDDREKQPLLLPQHIVVEDGRVIQLVHATRRLRTADYCIEGHGTACLIERKKDLREIAANTLTLEGRARFVAELNRFETEGIQHRYLLLEGNPATLTDQIKHPTRNILIDPGLALSSLLSLLIAHRVTPLYLPSTTAAARRAVGWYVAHLLVAHVLHSTTPCPLRTLTWQLPISSQAPASPVTPTPSSPPSPASTSCGRTRRPRPARPSTPTPPSPVPTHLAEPMP